MAFYGSLGEVNLGALDQSIIDNAVDIFVYDTSKDSDGGLWRNRTQNTSWYNEPLNTATRGSRREFPAVAVIVTTNSGENGQVIIYDGDDPDMPMWMKFNVGYNSPNRRMIGVNSAENLTSSTMLNAKLVTGTRDGAAGDGGVYIIDFISDNRLLYQLGGYFGPHIANEIANRNVGSNSRGTQYGSIITLVNGYINDVAMTVLPNAPIDSATGLPVPTIAVATLGGVSIIKDDGSVVDLKLTNSYNVEFTDDYKLVANINTESSTFSTHIYDAIPSTDSNTNGNRRYYRAGTGVESIPPLSGNNSESTANETRVLKDNIIAIPTTGNTGGTIAALNILQDNPTSQSNAMVAYITTSYNTGWMHGDIKGAFLSDTDATNVTGSELVTNGDFSSSTGWDLGINWTISGGVASHTSTAGYISQFDVLTVGLYYAITFTCTGTVILPNGTGVTPDNVIYTNGTYTHYGFAVNTDVQFYSNGTSTIDNVSVRRADPDRSVNNKGLQVFGTITKSPVATGAELVAYSGFNATNYLRGYMNISDPLSNFYLMGWFKHTNDQSTQQPVRVGDSNTYVSILRETVSGDESWGFSLRGAGGNTLSTFAPVGSVANVWTNIVLTSRGSNIELWVNGELIQTVSNIYSPFDWTNSTGIVPIQFGANPLVVTTDDVAMSLVRFGESVPSPEQIKKIYEDEKVLFQENAACTLYGSSDTVTALAYDDSNDTLHAGTSSGRSDFQGLRRINNTTTAVSTAISASNGLIAEQ